MTDRRQGGSASDDERPPRVELQGTAASPGIAIGRAFVLEHRKIGVPRVDIDSDAIEGELERLRAAMRMGHDQLEAIEARLPYGEHRQILKAQQMMLRDPDLLQRIEAFVRAELVGAEWAVARVTEEIGDLLGRAEQEHFRERRSDIVFLGERVILNLRGDQPMELQPPPGSIVVAHDLAPADAASLIRCQIVGLVTEAGTQTAHTAIMARAFEIPAVVGAENVLRTVRSGDVLVVDATQGSLIVRPSTEELQRWQQELTTYDAFEDRVQRDHALPAIAQDGVHVVLRANIGFEEEMGSAWFHGAEGIGLYRTEFMFMDRSSPPSEEEHYRRAKAVLRRTSPYPVVFRTFDLGSDKPCRLIGFDDDETNPAMGMRSLRLALRERDLFVAQLRGLLRAALHGPARIMLPLVSGVEELREAMKVVEEARQGLQKQGFPFAEEVPIGVMVETPSAALTADIFAKHADFMSIGTNDLIQYTFAIDRENEDVGYLYRPLHPSILRLIRMVVDAGRSGNVPVSLCGEMASDPRCTWVLVGLGVLELSMHSTAIPVIKSIIRGSHMAEMTELADRVLAVDSADEAEAIVFEKIAQRFPEELRHGGWSVERRVQKWHRG